jgi:hypothetical protein
MEPGVGRAALAATVEKLRSRHPDARIEYASWTDDDGHEGVRIEHWPSSDVRSALVPSDYAMFKDSLGRTYVGSYSEILEKEKSCLLLDCVDMKLSLNGKRPGSKDIPSQSVAVEVMSRIINSQEREVSSSRLPASSYSKDKGLLMSKALSPLANFVERETGKPFKLSCNGTGGKFTVSLAKTEVRVGVVSRQA